MNISFDLDSTLIPHGNEFDTEKRTLISRLLGIEEIRKGTCKLFEKLQNHGHEIHIYTTSYRKKWKIKQTFRHYGLKIGRVINQIENQQTLKSLNINSSKYPPAYNFDLHVDDSAGVEIEAERFKFKVIIVEPMDKNWIEKIETEVRTLGNNKYT